MAALFSKPKTPPAPKPVKIEAPAAPVAPPTSPSDTAAGEQGFLRSRRRKGSGLAGLILSPLGGSSGGKPTLGGGVGQA